MRTLVAIAYLMSNRNDTGNDHGDSNRNYNAWDYVICDFVFMFVVDEYSAKRWQDVS